VAGAAEARPPVEWTAEEPEGKRRVVLIAVAAFVFVALLVFAIVAIAFAAPVPSP
jgi:hypothetical protein